MPTALDRLLARPSTLRILRSILDRPEPLSVDSLRCTYNRYSQKKAIGLAHISIVASPSETHGDLEIADSAEDVVQTTKSAQEQIWREAELVRDAYELQQSHKVSIQSSPDGVVSETPSVIEEAHAESSVSSENRALKIYQQGRRSYGNPDNLENTSSVEQIRSGRGPRGSQTYLRGGLATSWKNMRQESDVARIRQGPDEKTPRLLVDMQNNNSDPALWVKLLQYRERVDGAKGVREVWEGMRRRNIDLPVNGRYGKILWTTFIKEKSLLAELVPYSVDLLRRKQTHYKEIFWTILDTYLSADPDEALKWYFFLKKHDQCKLSSLRKFAATIEPTQKALDSFRLIYQDFAQEGVYDALIGNLLDRKKYQLAHEWHYFLQRHNDLPEHPRTKAFAERGAIPFPTMTIDRNSANHFVGDAESQRLSGQQLLKRETMSRILGEAHSVRPKELSDEFCARLFATKAFSITSAIKILGMLGAESIGPLALKELVVRTKSPSEVLQAMAQVVSAGLVIRKCTFSQTVEKFAAEGRRSWLYSLAGSDQHPEVLEDPALLHRLVRESLGQGDLDQAYRTLHILTISHFDPARESWSILLRHYCMAFPLDQVQMFIEDMRSHRIQLTSESLTFVHNYCLRHRSAGKRPVTRGYRGADVVFVTNVFKMALETGMNLHPLRWREIIKRLGMSGAMTSLTRLLMYLLVWYKPTKPILPPVTEDRLPGVRGSPRAWSDKSQEALRLIFDPNLIKAVIAWGFRYGLGPQRKPRGAMKCHSWARGVRILRKLRELGVEIDDADVKKELSTRFLILYGTGRITATRWGRFARSNNPYTLKEMVQVAEREWGQPLWGGETDSLPTGTKHPDRRIRRPHKLQRRPSLSASEDEHGGEEMIPVADAKSDIMRSLGLFK